MYFWEIFDFIGLPFVCGVTAGVNLPDTGNAVLVWCHNCLMSLMGQDMVSELSAVSCQLSHPQVSNELHTAVFS